MAVRTPARIIALALLSLGLASCGGSDDTPAEGGNGAPDAVGDAPLLEEGGGDAVAAIEAWAEPLRAAGFTVTYDDAADGATTLTNLVIAGPEALPVGLTTASASRLSGEGGTLTFVPDGEQQLTMTLEGEAIDRTFQSASVELTRSESGDAGESLSFEFAAAVLDGGAAETMSVAAMLADGVATYQIALVNFTIAGDSPFGSSATSIGALLMAADAAIAVSDIAVDWGPLQMTGAGEMQLDETGRLSGRFDMFIGDVLVMLDSIRAWSDLDREAMSAVYAAILLEMSREPDAEMLPFAVTVDGATMTLLGESRGAPDLELGAVIPFLSGAAE
jgi:hypothetical protein